MEWKTRIKKKMQLKSLSYHGKDGHELVMLQGNTETRERELNRHDL